MVACNSLIETLSKMKGRKYVSDLTTRTLANGNLAVTVAPNSIWDRLLLLSGMDAEVWIQPGAGTKNLACHTARAYSVAQRDRVGKVALVLGDGDIAAITPLDVFHKLFTEHEGIDEVHITGSGKTHHLIVWGTGMRLGETGQRRLRGRSCASHSRCPRALDTSRHTVSSRTNSDPKMHNSGFNHAVRGYRRVGSMWYTTLSFLIAQNARCFVPRLGHFRVTCVMEASRF